MTPVPRPKYPRPPIIEAVIDLRFEEAVSREELVSSLSAQLVSQYPATREDRELFELRAGFSRESLETSSRRSLHTVFLKSGDGLRLLGCGEGSLSIHVLAPYPGWENFLEQAKEAIDALPAKTQASGLSGMAIRYIDRIPLTSPELTVDMLLTIMPRYPAEMPQQMKGFHIVTRSVDPTDQAVATLTVASVPGIENESPAVLYDLSIQRVGEPLCSLDDETWRQIAEDLHWRQGSIFEASITQKARDLFK